MLCNIHICKYVLTLLAAGIGSYMCLAQDTTADFVRALEISPFNNQIAVGTQNGELSLIDQANDSTHVLLNSTGIPITSIDWSPNGNLFVVGSGNGLVQIWDATEKRVINTLEDDRYGISQVDWSPDETRILSATTGNGTRIWNAISGSLVAEIVTGETYQAEWHPASTYFATSGYSISIWSGVDYQRVNTFPSSYLTSSLAWNTFGDRLAYGDVAFDDAGNPVSSIHVINAFTGVLELAIVNPSGLVQEINWSSNDQYFLSASGGNIIQMWSANSGQQVESFTTEASVFGFDVSMDQNSVFYANANQPFQADETQTITSDAISVPLTDEGIAPEATLPVERP